MKISIVIYGTRGDVQPMTALACALKKSGYEVLICAPPENEELVKRYGCDFEAVGSSIRDIFKREAAKKRSPRTEPTAKFMKQEITAQFKVLPDLLKGSDLVIGVGYVFGISGIAESLGIPYRFMAFYPAILGAPRDAPFLNRSLWKFGKMIMNLVFKSFINNKRAEIGVKPIRDVWADWMGENVIVATDPALYPVPAGVDFRYSQTGYMILPSLTGLEAPVEKFLSSGKPPVFIGFGSIPVHDSEKLSKMIIEVSNNMSERFIISKGWDSLIEIESHENCLFVDEVPFDYLFPRLAAVVHHGGTGTIAAAARAGIPQVVCPLMADQFENQKMIVKTGLGPQATYFKKLSVKTLSVAIRECLDNESYKIKAREISEVLNKTDGTELTLRVILNELDQIKQNHK